MLVTDGGVSLKGAYHYFCRCDCGTFKTVSSRYFRSGMTRSCSCLLRDWRNRVATFHGAASRQAGDRKRALYSAWGNMRQRVWNEHNPAWKHYGGRGLMICSSWTFFAIFSLDMQGSWQPGLSLERLDNDDGYGPHNCTWRAQKSATTKPAPERSLEVTGSRRSRHEMPRST